MWKIAVSAAKGYTTWFRFTIIIPFTVRRSLSVRRQNYCLDDGLDPLSRCNLCGGEQAARTPLTSLGFVVVSHDFPPPQI